MASSKCVIVAIVLFAVLNVVSANIQCFQCAEEKGGDGICRDQAGNKHVTVSCPYSCITHTLAPISIGGVTSGEIVTRVCSDPSYCELGVRLVESQMGLKTRGCTSCKSDYCNSGSTAIPSFILLGVLAVKYYFF